MNRTNHLVLRPLAALLLAAACGAAHAEPEAMRWVVGSWVNIRATAAPDAPVVDHLTTNTPVLLRAENGKSCEIGWRRKPDAAATSNANADGQGFIPCKLLGKKPLTIEDATWEVIGDSTPNPNYSPLRAFWIEPSMEHLLAAGEHFAKTLLNPAQRALENGETGERIATAPRLVRYPVPEFDAMKALMAKGVIAPGANGKAWAESCEEIREPSPDSYWLTGLPACRLPGMALRLPKVRPSLFKESDRLVPADAGVEDMSAAFGIVERGKTISGPKWEADDNVQRYTGAWDIGTYEILLDKPVVEHVIGRTGLVGAYRWQPRQVKTLNSRREFCGGRLADARRAKDPVAGYPEISDELLWFYTPQALPLRKASIKTRVERASAKAGAKGIGRVVVYEIDLNGDGVPDLVRWEINAVQDPDRTDATLLKWESYINVNGRWYPFGWNIDVECT